MTLVKGKLMTGKKALFNSVKVNVRKSKLE